MFNFLKIENYALIDSLEIDFSNGMSTITGETGAGKSILVGALSLILGQRADTQVLFDKKRKCIVEGTFRIEGYGLENFFEENELDYDGNTILRREINQYGKSRAFINDTPVKLNVLKEIGDKLVDIHSQLSTLTLNESEFQLTVIDSYAKNDTLLKKYKSDYYNYLDLKKNLNLLIEQENKAKADKDYFQFQFDELDKANLRNSSKDDTTTDEQAELEKELEILNNSEFIKKSLFDATYVLENSDINVINKLNEVLSSIQKIAEFHPDVNELGKRLETSRIELKDISKEIENIETRINFDPVRIEKINERLDLIYNLEKKHNVTSANELVDIMNNLSDKLLSISTLDESIIKLRKEAEEKYKLLHKTSESLTSGRKKHIPLLEKEIIGLLKELGMPDAQFKIILTELSELNQAGKDKVVYLFNANRGGELKEISRVASGGELSRLMLSIKSTISQRNLLPTLILDEIDVGVSGDIAGKVGNIIQKMSAQMQVITITHQPQIAAKGDMHYLVYKETDKKTTRSAIRKLSDNDRVEEIAKMISGDKISKSAAQTAKEMMK